MRKETYFTDDQLFCENCVVQRKYVKKRIVSGGLLEYRCSSCGNIGEWQGQKLVLQLEHRNGVNDDNRLENLCFLCPNCHSQTETYCGKNKSPSSNKRSRVREEKSLALKKERIDYLSQVDRSWGWIVKVSKDWGVSHTQVKRWISLNYPSFIDHD